MVSVDEIPGYRNPRSGTWASNIQQIHYQYGGTMPFGASDTRVAEATYLGLGTLAIGSLLMILPQTGSIGKITKKSWWPYAGTFLVGYTTWYLTDLAGLGPRPAALYYKVVTDDKYRSRFKLEAYTGGEY